MDISSFCSCHDLEWRGCYGSGAKYQRYIIPESVKHPAKMSWDLLERIFKHLESMDLINHDSIIIDFMAGSGRTGTIAALRRYRTISVELEPHFIEMIAGYDCDGSTISDFRIEPCVCKSDMLHRPHIIRTGLFEVECSGNPRIIPVCRCGTKVHHKKHHIPGNRELIEQATGRKVKWDVIQGDSRELTKLLHESEFVGVISPPYFSQVAYQDKDFIKSIAEDKSQRYRDGRLKGHFATPEAIRRYAEKIMENYSLDPRNIGNLPDAPLMGIMSPPYGDQNHPKGMTKEYEEKFLQKHSEKWGQNRARPLITHDTEYSDNPDNIGNLPDVPYVGIISPPYQDTAMPSGCPSHIRKLAREGKWDEAIEIERKVEAENVKKGNKYAVSTNETIRKKIEMALEMEKGNYSENPDNIGNLKDVPLAGIMSPPYSEAQQGGGIAIEGYNGPHIHEMGKNQPGKVGRACGYMKDFHGSDPSQIGNLPDRQQGESYLSAMLEVYKQAFLCGISPLVVVTKDPTRNGKLRMLSADTVQILQLAGYEIFDYHRAILFESHKQETLDGDTKDVHIGRISFFKRLSLEKGGTAAKWEDIIFARIPIKCARPIPGD